MNTRSTDFHVHAESQPFPPATRTEPADWVRLHGDALFRYAVLRVPHRELAEEIVQETFLAAWRGRSEFSGHSTERTWLIGILRRKIVDHFRAHGSSPPEHDANTADLPALELFDARGVWTKRVAVWPQDPARELTKQEFWAALDECMSKLPESVAGAFCLRELEQIDAKDTCKILGLSATNLWTRLHRARMLLRQCLEKNWFAGRDAKE